MEPVQGPTQSSQDVAAKLTELLEKEKRRRGTRENKWKRSVAFMRGQQHSEWNDLFKRWDPLNTEPGRKRPSVERRTVDQVGTITDGLLAKLTKNSPRFSGVAKTADKSAQEAASLSEKIMSYEWKQLRMGPKLAEVIQWSFVVQGFFEVYYDSNNEERIMYKTYPAEYLATLNPDFLQAMDLRPGDPIVEDGIRDTVVTWAQAHGVQIEERALVRGGKIDVEVVSPFELFLLGGNTPHSAHTAVKVKGYSPEYVKRRWNVDLKPDARTTDEMNTEIRSSEGNHDEVDHILTRQFYVKPTKEYPKGRYIVVAQKKIIHESTLPYNHGCLPFIQISGTPSVGDDFPQSLVERLIPLQEELNAIFSDIARHRKYTLNPVMMAIRGSVDPKFKIEPGKIMFYDARNGSSPPVWRELPALPNWVFEYINQLLQRMEDISGLHEVSNAKLPANVEAATAINLLQETDDNKLALRVRDIELAIETVGKQVLALARQFYSDMRIIEISGEDGLLEIVSFRGADLEGADVEVQEWSMMPESKAQHQQQLKDLLDGGHITKEEYLSLSDVGGAKQLNALWQADRQKQEREIDELMRGKPMPEPQDWEDDQSHADVCRLWLNSSKAQAAPQDVFQAVAAHWNAHHQRMAAVPPPPGEPPNINLSLRADAPPELVAALTGRNGLPIDAQTIADSLDQQVTAEQNARASAHAVAKTQIEKETQTDKMDTQMQLAEHQALLEQDKAAHAHNSAVEDKAMGVAPAEEQPGGEQPSGQNPAEEQPAGQEQVTGQPAEVGPDPIQQAAQLKLEEALAARHGITP